MAKQVAKKTVVQTKSGLALDTIGSVMIYAADFNRAFDFYTKTLGLKVAYKEKGFCSFDTKPVPLFLHWGKGGKTTSQTTVVHFRVKNFYETWKKLKGIGVKNLTDPRSPCSDELIAKFEDPDGNPLEIVGRGKI